MPPAVLPRPWPVGPGAARSAARSGAEPAALAAVGASFRGPAPAYPTRPFPVTALRATPARIAWQAAPASDGYRLEVACAGASVWAVCSRPVFAWPGECTIPSGEVADWRISCIQGSSSAVSGEFRVLSAAEAARLGATEELLREVRDPWVRAIAHAIASAEDGLFDDAFASLEAVALIAASGEPHDRGREALLQRAFVTILREVNGRASARRFPALEGWLSRRQAWHEASLGHLLTPASALVVAPSMRSRPRSVIEGPRSVV